MKKKFDYIICGAGLSGLIMLNKILNEPIFNDKKILVIEKDLSHKKNKTWCFWEKKQTNWDNFAIKSWNNIIFKTSDFKNEVELENYCYKMIKSKSLFTEIIKKVQNKNNFTIVEDDILELTENNNDVYVKTKHNEYCGKTVFSSIFDINEIKEKIKLPLLLQHFKGWTIKTEEFFFNDKKATIMDFSIEQKNETRFFYVLPINKKEALIEFTLFSKNILNKEEYNQELKKYISSIGIKKYEVTTEETGVIPMTCHPFENSNSKRIIKIGTAGGWTKPSSGYTFKFVEKNIDRLISLIKNDKKIKRTKLKTRHWIYDLIFLDVLYHNNEMGEKLFGKMFSKNKTECIFKFLDNESSLFEDFKIFTSFPKSIFIKSLIKNLGKIISNY